MVEEFSDLYVFHLRGDIRKNMLSKGAAREGQNVFDAGSMTGVSISLLVKNPEAQEHGRLFFHDIGPDLTTKEKLGIIRNFGSTSGISESAGWHRITPDEKNDWLDQADPSFDQYISMGSGERGRTKQVSVFETASLGINSNRDQWAYNASARELSNNMQRMISCYNDEVVSGKTLKEATRDPKMIKWSSSLTSKFERKITGEYSENWITSALYRPFTVQHLYGEPLFIHRYGKQRRIFPSTTTENLFIHTSGVGARSGFSALMANKTPDIQHIDNGQCFPFYLYDEAAPNDGIFAGDDQDPIPTRRNAITNEGIALFQAAYPGEEISKEDLFYYVYGLLHSPEYRERFKNNLAKALPRIPAVRTFADFAAFRDAGRALGDLHVNFESVEPYMVTFKEGTHDLIPDAQDDPVKFYRVNHTNKWKWGGKGKEKDKTTVIYNDNITMENVPLEAYDYVVNGKPALDWVMERQVVKQDKSSGIVNDANDYANETIGDPRYPLDLFRRVITVSLETMKIVRALPPLEIDR